jgi:hypothetical protein
MKSIINKLKELIGQDKQVVIELGKTHFYQGLVLAIIDDELVQLKVKGERKDKDTVLYIPINKILAFWEGDVEKSAFSVGFLMGKS